MHFSGSTLQGDCRGSQRRSWGGSKGAAGQKHASAAPHLNQGLMPGSSCSQRRFTKLGPCQQVPASCQALGWDRATNPHRQGTGMLELGVSFTRHLAGSISPVPHCMTCGHPSPHRGINLSKLCRGGHTCCPGKLKTGSPRQCLMPSCTRAPDRPLGAGHAQTVPWSNLPRAVQSKSTCPAMVTSQTVTPAPSTGSLHSPREPGVHSPLSGISGRGCGEQKPPPSKVCRNRGAGKVAAAWLLCAGARRAERRAGALCGHPTPM